MCRIVLLEKPISSVFQVLLLEQGYTYLTKRLKGLWCAFINLLIQMKPMTYLKRNAWYLAYPTSCFKKIGHRSFKYAVYYYFHHHRHHHHHHCHHHYQYHLYHLNIDIIIIVIIIIIIVITITSLCRLGGHHCACKFNRHSSDSASKWNLFKFFQISPGFLHIRLQHSVFKTGTCSTTEEEGKKYVTNGDTSTDEKFENTPWHLIFL